MFRTKSLLLSVTVLSWQCRIAVLHVYSFTKQSYQCPHLLCSACPFPHSWWPHLRFINFPIGIASRSVWHTSTGFVGCNWIFIGINIRNVLTLALKLWLSSIQSLSPVWLFATPWTAAGQASLSITSSRSLLKLRSFELVRPPSNLILSRPLLLLPSIFPSKFWLREKVNRVLSQWKINFTYFERILLSWVSVVKWWYRVYEKFQTYKRVASHVINTWVLEYQIMFHPFTHWLTSPALDGLGSKF